MVGRRGEIHFAQIGKHYIPKRVTYMDPHELAKVISLHLPVKFLILSLGKAIESSPVTLPSDESATRMSATVYT